MSQPAPEPGRMFDQAPRVVRCYADHRGVVFFQPMDNPFGSPAAVYNIWKTNTVRVIRERLYGWATKTFSGQFPGFSRELHVLPESRIPTVGTNYQMIDPTPGARPFFFIYLRICGETVYVLSDWPAQDPPGAADVPFGKWAEPSGKKGGINDGDLADAADTIKWGVQKYVQEFARLEGWDFEEARTFREQEAENDEAEERDYMYPHLHKVALIEARNRGYDEADAALPGSNAKLKIEQRGIDSRAASSPRIENDRTSSLYEMLKDYGLEMCLAPGIAIDERVQMTNTLFDYEENAEGEIIDPPKLYISEKAKNLIFALEYWTGADGPKGATKDPIDCLCYAACKIISGEWYDITEEVTKQEEE